MSISRKEVIFIASVIVTNVTATTISAMITGLSGDPSGYSNPRINCSIGQTIYTMSGTFYGLPPDTTMAVDGWIFYKDPNDFSDLGSDYYLSGQYATTLRARPYSFAWYSQKTSGSNFYVSSTEWNAFTSRINEFLYYKYMSTYSFTQAVSGQPFYYYIFNEARNQIARMISVSVPTFNSGDTIYASYFNDLLNSLNSIY